MKRAQSADATERTVRRRLVAKQPIGGLTQRSEQWRRPRSTPSMVRQTRCNPVLCILRSCACAVLQ